MRQWLKFGAAVATMTVLCYFAGNGAEAAHPYGPYFLLPFAVYSGHIAARYALR